MPDTPPEIEEYTTGTWTPAPKMPGFIAGATGRPRSENPYPVETADWRAWLEGYDTPSGETWEKDDVVKDVP